MGCPEYEILIAKYLDDALSEDEQASLMLHLAACVDCRVTVNHYRRLDQRLQTLSSPIAPVKVRRELFHRAEKGYLWETRGFWRRTSVRIASGFIAAVVVVALMLLPLLVSTWMVNGAPKFIAGAFPLQTIAQQRQVVSQSARIWVALDQPITGSSTQGVIWKDTEAEARPCFVMSNMENEPAGTLIKLHAINNTKEKSSESNASIALSRMADWPDYTSRNKWRVIRIMAPDGMEIVRIVRVSFPTTENASEDIDRQASYDPIRQMTFLSK
jgi:hypothetical protein